uniref:TLDc domain-containing protein n=1 Tax=Macrostomum lignano TaxID=282301 RepID=A0A1I8JRN4_9PLAT
SFAIPPTLRSVLLSGWGSSPGPATARLDLSGPPPLPFGHSERLADWRGGSRSDKILLDSLCVSHIVDLTTESRPLLVPAHNYADFRRLHLPYPGCDFFSNWPAVDGAPLRYDWTGQAATLRLNGRLPSCAAAIAWQEYRSWDLDRLTANYLLIMLGYLTESSLAEMPGAGGDGGRSVQRAAASLPERLDRTPLFVSLIRLLLWSEGLAHASLSPSEILRLCLGYDWFLWGHRLPDRLAKGQRILEYCFHFVGLAADLPELSMVSHYPLIAGGSGDHCSNPNGMTRAEKLRCVSAMFAGALRRSSGSAGVDEADGPGREVAGSDRGVSLAGAAAGAVLGVLHGRTLGTCVRAAEKPVAAAGLAKPLGPAAVAAEAVGLSSVAPRLAMVPRRLSSSMMASSAAGQELPVAAAGTACDFSRLLLLLVVAMSRCAVVSTSSRLLLLLGGTLRTFDAFFGARFLVSSDRAHARASGLARLKKNASALGGTGLFVRPDVVQMEHAIPWVASPISGANSLVAGMFSAMSSMKTEKASQHCDTQ